MLCDCCSVRNTATRHGEAYASPLETERIERLWYGSEFSKAGHEAAFIHHPWYRRSRRCSQWLHQVRPDLGRLDAIAKILQVIIFENRIAWTADGPGFNGSRPGSGQGVAPMKVLRASMLLAALLSGPAFAQAPHINLLTDGPGKTQEEIEKQKADEKAYKDTLRKIPDAATSNDPWGGVRNGGQPKASVRSKPATHTNQTGQAKNGPARSTAGTRSSAN
jgi:hypothetical protein